MKTRETLVFFAADAIARREADIDGISEADVARHIEDIVYNKYGFDYAFDNYYSNLSEKGMTRLINSVRKEAKRMKKVIYR